MFEINYLHLKVTDWENKKNKLLNLMSERPLTLMGFNHTSYNSESEDIDLCQKIKDILEKELFDIENITGMHNYHIDYAWFQEELNGMFHPVHNHGYGMSCICYLEFDPEYHTPVQFLSPYPEFSTGITQYYSPENVESGSLLAFPSMLNHYTIPNQSSKSRKILSFNIKC